MDNLEKINELNNRLESDPTDFKTRRELAIEFMENGYNEEALKQLYYLLKRFPEDSRLHYNAGIVLENLKQFDKAIVSYQNALKIIIPICVAVFVIIVVLVVWLAKTKYSVAINEKKSLLSKNILAEFG